MFVFNLKINKKTLLRIGIIIFSIICISLLMMSIYKVLKKIKNNEANIFVEDKIPSADIAKLTEKNFTNVLKEIHDDIDTYIGQKISFSGYVYRVNDLNENEFILARDMELNSTNQTAVVGFLSYYEKAEEFDNYTWINVVGTIEKSTFHNETLPRLKIEEIEIIDKPENSTVTIPDSYFVPTAVIY